MTKEDAFNIIDGVCSRVSGSRQDHLTIMEAMRVIQQQLFVGEDAAKAPIKEMVSKGKHNG